MKLQGVLFSAFIFEKH